MNLGSARDNGARVCKAITHIHQLGPTPTAQSMISIHIRNSQTHSSNSAGDMTIMATLVAPMLLGAAL